MVTGATQALGLFNDFHQPLLNGIMVLLMMWQE
jgi:hypothetical protein